MHSKFEHDTVRRRSDAEGGCEDIATVVSPSLLTFRAFDRSQLTGPQIGIVCRRSLIHPWQIVLSGERKRPLGLRHGEHLHGAFSDVYIPLYGRIYTRGGDVLAAGTLIKTPRAIREIPFLLRTHR